MKKFECISLDECLDLYAPINDYDSFELKAEIVKCLLTIPTKEAYILRARYGIGTPEQTLEEIGKDIGVGKNRVMQIQHKALRMLLHPARTTVLKELI